MRPKGRSYRTTTREDSSSRGGNLTSAVPISAMPFVGTKKEKSKSGREVGFSTGGGSSVPSCWNRWVVRDIDGMVATKPFTADDDAKRLKMME